MSTVLDLDASSLLAVSTFPLGFVDSGLHRRDDISSSQDDSILHRLFVVYFPPSFKTDKSSREVWCRAQNVRYSGAGTEYCIGSANTLLGAPSNQPICRWSSHPSRVQSPESTNTHGYRHRSCGLRQGPGDTSRIDESDKEQNVLQPVRVQPHGRIILQVQHPTTAWNSLYIDATLQPKHSHLLPRPSIPSAIPSSTCPLLQ